MADLSGKIALVTGAASGIGKSCSERLAKAGATVVLTDVQDSVGKAVCAAINKSGGKAIYLHQDVTSEDEWIGVIAEVRAQFGRLDVFVNNAGIGIGGLVTEMTLETWRKQQAINVEGVFLGVKHSLPLMRTSGEGGSIINMSSVAGLKGSAGMSAYCATKGAVRLFSKSIALECAAAGDKIRVNSVHPGPIDTDMLSVRTPEQNQARINQIPMGRLGSPDEVANVVCFLLSDEARYMTGSELAVDGGCAL